jgi:hypothetical protein
LSKAKKEYNRRLSRDRVLVENFFGRWKSLVRIVAQQFRGSRLSLRKIVPITIVLTNWYIERHPLRANEIEKLTESDAEERAHAVAFVGSSSD